jgi:hypothetical protein
MIGYNSPDDDPVFGAAINLRFCLTPIDNIALALRYSFSNPIPLRNSNVGS